MNTPPGIKLSRRTLLKSGLVGAGVVALGGVGLALRSSRLDTTSTPTLRCMDEKEYAIFAALAERVCPAAGEGAPGAASVGVPAMADAWLSGQHPDVQDGFRIALGAFESALVGALFGERVTPFTQLGPSEQDAVIESWQHSSVPFRRTVAHGLTSLAAALYYAQPVTWPRLGYGGPPSVTALRAGFAENLVDLDALEPGAGQAEGTEPPPAIPATSDVAAAQER